MQSLEDLREGLSTVETCYSQWYDELSRPQLVHFPETCMAEYSQNVVDSR